MERKKAGLGHRLVGQQCEEGPYSKDKLMQLLTRKLRALKYQEAPGSATQDLLEL